MEPHDYGVHNGSLSFLGISSPVPAVSHCQAGCDSRSIRLLRSVCWTEVLRSALRLQGSVMNGINYS
jgi:hypothetical protein